MSQANISWQWQTFLDLSHEDLYQILQLREAVFQLEQQCLYQDLDGCDQMAMHCQGLQNSELVAYARIREIEQAVTIERVITRQSIRGQKLGRGLLEECLSYLEKHYPLVPISIGAQLQLEAFYQSFGFEGVGKPYDDAGIMHIKMVKR
jgi:ElaA protein